MAQVLDLPVEMLDEILDHVDDPNDLTSLARVNRAFHLLTDKRIWNRADQEHRYRILMWACAAGNAPALCRLLKLGFTPNLHFQLETFEYPDEIDAAFYLSLEPGSYVAIPYMDDFFGSDDHEQEPHLRQFWKPLHAAVYHGHGHIVNILIRHGAWVDEIATNYHGCGRPLDGPLPVDEDEEGGRCTPLHVALCSGEEEIAKTLISNGASMYVDRTVHRWAQARDPNRTRITALHLCAYHGLLSTAEYLVKEGYHTSIDELDEFGNSPIMYAYITGYDDIFYYLLSQGANTRLHEPVREGFGRDTFYPEFYSFLHQACRDRRWEIVFKLVEHGCDVFEPDDHGNAPLDLCIMQLNTTTLRSSRDETKRHREVQEMIKTIESCGMNGPIDQGMAIEAAKYALQGAVTPLLSFLLDRGLDISTLMASESIHAKGELDGGYTGYEHSWPREFKPRNYYHDTGLFPCEQTLLEYACCCNNSFLYINETIDLLLARGCIRSGDVPSHVRVLKNLCCKDSSWRDEASGSTQLHAVRKICSHLTATVQGGISRPKLPVSLFFICLDNCQRVILDELLNVFDLPDWHCSEEELESFLVVLTSSSMHDIASRRLGYLDLVLVADKNGYLLQDEHTFEKLCRTFLEVEGGEKAALGYLDRGGRYSLRFSIGTTALWEACATGSLQLAERLIDMGAHPRTLVSCDLPYNFSPISDGVWYRNSGDVAILRLLIKKGADPFPSDETDYPFRMYTDDSFLDFFRVLCELTINNKTNDRYLSSIIDHACAYGKHTAVQVLRSCASRRVDTIIRDKAVFFLQRLLAVMYHYDWYDCHTFHSCLVPNRFSAMNEAVDLMKLILELGPARTLTSRWRLKLYRSKGLTALKLLEKLLTPPKKLHTDWDKKAPRGGHISREAIRDWDCFSLADKCRYTTAWCLNERVRIDTIKGKPNITITDRAITLPSDSDETRCPFFKESHDPWHCVCF